MGAILGLGTTDFPMLRMVDGTLTGVLDNALKGEHFKEETKDQSKWPEPMQKELGDDHGVKTGAEKRARQVEQFRKLKLALDDFKPDLMLIWSKDNRESLKNFSLPPFWIQAYEKVDLKLFQLFGNPNNFFEEDPERVDTILGHPEAANLLINGLQDQGFDGLLLNLIERRRLLGQRNRGRGNQRPEEDRKHAKGSFEYHLFFPVKSPGALAPGDD